MSKFKIWINAFRLRTLPLSVSGVLMGTAISVKEGDFNASIFLLAIATTLFLQVLSNLANDYGDSRNGKDNEGRIGPVRMVQSGKISMPEMRRMIAVFCLLSLVSGVFLIYVSDITLLSVPFFILLALGVAAIYAAITYTIGKNPYGYCGWGDVSVFIFFGLFSVLGTCFLFSHSFSGLTILPAITVGLFSVGVLNLNNMRDFLNDKATGKISLVVKMGPVKAKQYHFVILVVAMLSALAYLSFYRSNWPGYLCMVILFPLTKHLQRVWKNKEPQLLDAELKRLALIALFFTVFFGVCINC